MIIGIKGTSGSGKSTIVRQVVERYGVEEPIHVEGRKQPFYTIHHSDKLSRSLVTLGHYNTPCGGCDTISKQATIFELIREHHAAGRDVLFEGLLVSGEVTNTAQLHKDGLPLEIIGLDVPVDLCIDSVNQRRWAKFPDKPGVKPDNTVAKHRGVRLAIKRLQAEGVSCTWANREAALNMVAGLLGWGPQHD